MDRYTGDVRVYCMHLLHRVAIIADIQQMLMSCVRVTGRILLHKQ